MIFRDYCTKIEKSQYLIEACKSKQKGTNRFSRHMGRQNMDIKTDTSVSVSTCRSQSQGVLNQSSHRCTDGGAQSVSDLEGDFVKVWLDIFEAGVENVVHLGLRGHLWEVFVAVDHLHNVYHLLAQLLPDFLPTNLSLLLIGQVDDVHFDAPNFPGNALV